MGFILVSFLIVAGLLGGLYVLIKKGIENDFLSGVIVVLAIVCIGVGIVEGVYGYVTVDKYEEVEMLTIELVKVRDHELLKDGRAFYVLQSDRNTYTYYTKLDLYCIPGNTRAYMDNKISSSNVRVVEDDIYTNGRLVVYTQKPEKSFWTFAVGREKIQYVFYIPIETIIREDELKNI